MINLPKPSKFRMNSSAREQNEYIIGYLEQLVFQLEKLLAGSARRPPGEKRAITDIRFSGSTLIITRENGERESVNVS